MTHGQEVPNSAGLFGGYPGSCVRQRLMRGSDLAERQAEGVAPGGLSELQGETEELGPKTGLVELRPGDVFETSWQGGGGLGDPLDRDAQLVTADVARGVVGAATAECVYGVASDGDEARRAGMRRERLAAATGPARGSEAVVTAPCRVIAGGLQFGEVGGATWFACTCGRALAPRDGNWREGAARRILPAEEAGPGIRLHVGLELRQFLCAACGRSLAVDVAEKTMPDLQDIDLS